MSYSPEVQSKVYDEQQKKISRDISICQKVKTTVDSAGWKDIIAPLIDRMIVDVLGGKLGENWVSGKLDRARSDEKREFHIGYKQALIELHSRVMNHIRQLPILEEQLKHLITEREKGYRVPMEETRYNVDKEL